jgi:hypothetical protein
MHGYSSKQGSVAELKIATRRFGASQPLGTTAKDWFHWSVGIASSDAQFDWNSPGTVAGTKALMRNGEQNAATEESTTKAGFWNIQLDSSTNNVKIWDDRRWGFADN